MAGVGVRIHPFFWLLIIGSVWTGFLQEMITLFVLIIIHELGHVSVARACQWRVRRIQLLPFGGVAEVEEWGNTDPGEEFMVALAGPFLNAVMWGIGWFFGRIGLWEVEWAHYFMWCNAIIAGFNLLPIWPLDGGKMVQALLSMGVAYRRAVYLTYAISFIGLLILSIISFTILWFHLNLLMIIFYLTAQNIMDYKYIPYQLVRFWLMKYEALKKNDSRWPQVFREISPEIKVEDTLKYLRKTRNHYFLLRGQRKRRVRIIHERDLLQVYFDKKQPQCAVSDVFM